jgi:hypothetical protein
LVSDLVSNLIYDILSEYTFEKVNELNKGDTLDEVDINYWDEKKKAGVRKKHLVYYITTVINLFDTYWFHIHLHVIQKEKRQF